MATIILSAGHNKFTGARAIDKTDEWSWNTRIMNCLANKLKNLGHAVHILHRDKSLSYGRAMKKLASEMRPLNPDLCLELHFNSSAPSANGFEFLHWLGSSKGQALAKSIGRSFGADFPMIKQRGNNDGARSLWFFKHNMKKAYHGRGGAYVYRTPCPAVICEPGFASNSQDWSTLKASFNRIATAYAEGIENYLQKK